MRTTMDAVIFDVDGTLVDSVDLHARCWRRAFRRFGVDLSLEAVRAQIGKGGDQLLPAFLDHYEINRFGKDLERYRSRLWKRRFLSRVVAFSGVAPLFRQIRRNGIRIAVASSAKEDEVAHYLDLCEVGSLVEVTVSADDTAHAKPHADLFRVALADLKVDEPGRACAVGDTPWDAMAAARAGLQTIGMLTGGWEPAVLRRAGCFAIYVDPEDLLRRYDDSPLHRPEMYRQGRPLPEFVP